MRSRNRCLAAAGIILLIGILSACERPTVSPSDVVAEQLDQIQDEQLESDLDSLIGDKSVAKEYSEEYEQLIQKLQDYEYEVTGEKISDDGETAEVTVTIHTYDFAKAYEELYQQVVKDADDGKIDADTDLTKYIYELLFDKVMALENRDYSADVTVHLTKNEQGDWETDLEKNDAVQNALLGGLLPETGDGGSAGSAG